MDWTSRGQNQAAGSCENTVHTVWVLQNVGKPSPSTSVVELAPISFSRSRDRRSIFYRPLVTPRNECRGRNSADAKVASLRARPGLTNLWNACPKWQAAFTAVSVLFCLFCQTSVLYIVKNVCTYTHISHCLETVYELPLLPNDTAVRSVDLMYITGVPAWQWLGEYVTLDRTFRVFFWNRN